MTEARHDPATICSLPGEALSERLAWIRSEILSHAVATESHDDTITFELAEAPGLAEKLERLIALERECCSGIDFAHERVPDSGRHRLSLRGVDPRAPVFASLAAAERPRSGIAGRLARAAGCGAAAALLVCCVLPVAAGALLGAALAAPLASLDDPRWIALASAFFAGAAFAWQGPRRRTRGSCGSAC